MKRKICLIISFLFISSAGMANGITELPAEIQALILSYASLSDIGKYCQLSKEANKVCQGDLLWQMLSVRDLGGLKRPDNMTWKNFYMESRFLGKFVLIPGGTYEIGSPPTEAGRANNENLHSIDLSPFSIMDAAVTQEAYAKVMGNNPSSFKEAKYCPDSIKEIQVDGQNIPVCADYPVEKVSYDDAVKFAERMNELDPGNKYSLPTEAQLEVAFRGGTKSAYVTGKDDEEGLGDYIWYRVNSKNQTHGVKSKQANEYGIYRSSVWEWAKDWYDANYAGSTGLDPQGPTSGSYRVFRGGSWRNSAQYSRSAYRNSSMPVYPYDFLGFRLVRTRIP